MEGWMDGWMNGKIRGKVKAFYIASPFHMCVQRMLAVGSLISRGWCSVGVWEASYLQIKIQLSYHQGIATRDRMEPGGPGHAPTLF